MESQSTESSWIYDFFAWLEVNKQRVLTGVILLAVVILAVGAYSWHKNKQEAEAGEALFAATPNLGARNVTVTPEDYMKIAQEHPNTTAAERAELLAGAALFGRGDSAKAQTTFENFVSNHGNSELVSQAAFGVAACLEAQNKVDQAIAKYEEVARQYPHENVAPQAKLAAARLYEAKDPAKAVKLYTDMEAAGGGPDMWKSEAIDRREKLLAKHPELRPAAPTSKVISSSPGEQVIEVTTPPAPDSKQPAAPKTNAKP